MQKLSSDSTDRDIALKLMEAVMYDNGWVNAVEPERFSPKWTKKIAPIAGAFFRANPTLLNDETVDLICTGGREIVEARFLGLDGYEALDTVLCEYFEDSGAT